MQAIFDLILEIENRFSRWAATGAATSAETKWGMSVYLNEAVDLLCAPSLVAECGWVRCKPKYPGSIETRYMMTWTDEGLSRSRAFFTQIGDKFRPYRRHRPDPIFHEYVLTVRQVSLRNGNVECGLCLQVFARYTCGRRIQVRHIDISDQFPHSVRLAIIDGDSLPDDISMSSYPLTSLLLLFANVLENVVLERK